MMYEEDIWLLSLQFNGCFISITGYSQYSHQSPAKERVSDDHPYD